MIFFQLVGAVLQFGLGQLVQTQLGLAGLGGALLLTVVPVLIRVWVPRLLRTIHTSPEWWAAGLVVALVALCLQA
ncbi:hypothetical protein ACYF6T_10195 [Streptomyces sp. 7R007]